MVNDLIRLEYISRADFAHLGCGQARSGRFLTQRNFSNFDLVHSDPNVDFLEKLSVDHVPRRHCHRPQQPLSLEVRRVCQCPRWIVRIAVRKIQIPSPYVSDICNHAACAWKHGKCSQDVETCYEDVVECHSGTCELELQL